MPTSDVENVIAAIDTERIHQPQILAPCFVSHDEGNYPAQVTSSIPGVFGDEVGAAHTQL
ncbi:hypothetical protein IVB12_21425 [Bradyrhizobium sp. 179]|uniref:hypothetical protein n=1 Tax=Bradyrhizobium sp. 179 TaxID=2782648 RepID=UPI001FF7E606|nr:hypothetical protein [Bradyrhizobium sp. 179]MCK1544447.1 hypothetical protein [Bradyrhizobium sp. 179]